MRIALALSPLLIGCVSTFEVTTPVPPIRCDQPYFFDSDGDGWGNRDVDAHPPQLQCQADLATNYTATNARDCDDEDENVTGLVAGACPEDLVVGGVEWAGTIYGDNEYLVVYGTTDAISGDLADFACGPWGWGGQLATFDDVAEWAAVQDLLNTVVPNTDFYAGFVGIEPNGAGTGWEWYDGSTLDLLTVGPFCDDIEPAIVDEAWGQDLLAVVKQKGAADEDWCLSLPDAALPPEAFSPDYPGPYYDPIYGHFVCERAIPDPKDWLVYPEVPDSGSF